MLKRKHGETHGRQSGIKRIHAVKRWQHEIHDTKSINMSDKTKPKHDIKSTKALQSSLSVGFGN